MLFITPLLFFIKINNNLLINTSQGFESSLVGMADIIALCIEPISLSLSLTSDNGVHERSYSNLYEPRKVFGGFPPHS